MITRPDIHLLHSRPDTDIIPCIPFDLGRRLSVGQPTGLETDQSLYRIVRLQRPQFGEDRREDRGFFGSAYAAFFLSRFLFLAKDEAGFVFINRHHVGDQSSGHRKCGPVPVASTQFPLMDVSQLRVPARS